MQKSPYDILRKPVISEKSTLVKELENTVVFEVSKEATKAEIKSAVEKAFKVSVDSVRTVIVRGKNTRMGRHTGRKPNWKKAYVTLGEGDSIELFEGV
ncbi:MAG: 50S ribosomal protein L23 [Deltaproteobacteria bacterium]|nr:MAG: 50S ribosomal protein L23 [Deltaproteobacteria bacterium]